MPGIRKRKFLIFCLLLLLLSLTGCRKNLGKLVVETVPSGAEVWIDGKLTGYITPCTISGLREGEHFIRLYKEDYYIHEETVYIFAGKIVPLVQLLDPSIVNITISADGFSSLAQPLSGEVSFTISTEIEKMRGLTNIEVYLNNEQIPNLSYISNGVYNFTLDTSTKSDGSYLLRIIAILTNGRRVEKPVSIVISNNLYQYKDWTVMVYMAADNNLDYYGFALSDLNEMEEVGSTEQVNILVQADFYNDEAKRYLMTKDDDPGNVTSPYILLGETNTGDPNVLQDFLSWGMTNYPARHYMLVLWNHGSGILHENISTVKSRSICYDQDGSDYFNDWLTAKEVRLALDGAFNGRPLDLLVTDACLMQMAEVAWEWQGAISYLVGSEEVTPANGLPYHTIMKSLVTDPLLLPEDFVREILSCYAKYYQNYYLDFPLTISGLKLSTTEIQQFGEVVEGFVTCFLNETDPLIREEVKKLTLKTKGYDYPENKDLGHFLDLITSSTQIPDTSQLHLSALAARSALRNIVDANQIINPTKFGEDNGLAVLLPDNYAYWNLYSSYYPAMGFPYYTKWDKLIEELLEIPL